MKEIIKMEKDMVMEYGQILNFIVMKDIGKMVCKVAKENKHGIKEVNGKEIIMKEIFNKVLDVVLVNMYIIMEIFMKENGKIIRKMDMDVLQQILDINMEDIGQMVYKMGKEHKYGELKLNGEEINMKVNSKMDRDLVMGFIILEMDKLIKEIGKMEIDMEMEHIII